MDDRSIVRLYWDRDEEAIAVTDRVYGGYCRSIARNILGNAEDAEECVNDTWWRAWNAIPPHRPERLSTFLGKITRNLSFNKYRNDRVARRGGGETALILDELLDCVSGRDAVEEELDRRELARAVSDFLRQLPRERQAIFIRRYWYADRVADIGRALGKGPGAVSKGLERTRKQLRTYLTERGFSL